MLPEPLLGRCKSKRKIKQCASYAYDNASSENHSRLSSRSEDPTIKGGEGGFFFRVRRALLEQLQALMGSFGGQFVTCLTCPHDHLFGGQSWPGWSGSLRLMIWSWKMAPCYGELLHIRPENDCELDHDLRIFRSSDHPARTDPL